MLTRRQSSMILSVVASLAWTGCQRDVQPPASHQVTAPEPQVEVGSASSGNDLPIVYLLNLETVQTDLGLTADQMRPLNDPNRAYRERSRQFLVEARRISPSTSSFSSDGAASANQALALFADFSKESTDLKTKVLAMLTPSQSERLEQIQLQASIGAALTWPEIIKTLDLSEQQLAKLASLRDCMWQEVNAVVWPDLRDLDVQERLERVIEHYKALDQVQAEATQRMLEVLTPEQRTKVEELQGKKIDVTRHYDGMAPEDIEVWDFMQRWCSLD